MVLEELLREEREEGREEGRVEGLLNAAIKMLEKGFSDSEIMNLLDLSEEQIAKVKMIQSDKE